MTLGSNVEIVDTHELVTAQIRCRGTITATSWGQHMLTIHAHLIEKGLQGTQNICAKLQ